MNRSANPGVRMKNPSEMENQVYSKANSKVSEDVIIDVSHSTTEFICLSGLLDYVCTICVALWSA